METETIEAPTEITKESLLAEAHKVDNQNAIDEGFQSAEDSTAERATVEEQVKPETEKEGIKPESSETKPETEEVKAQRERDEKGRFKPKAEVKAEEIKPTDSAYEKAKKEEARQKSVLSNFEAEKTRVRAELDAEKQVIAQEKAKIQQLQSQQRPEATKDGFTAREYWQAAQEFAKAGDYDAAYKAQATAIEIRNYETTYFQQQSQAQRQQQQTQAFNSDMEKVIQDNPDLKDGTTSISQAVQQVLGEYPYLFYVKDGFTTALKAAKMQMEAGMTSELRTKLEQTQAKLEEAIKATTPARGGPTSPSSPKEFNNMDSKDQREFLKRQAEQMDNESNAA